MVGDATQFFCCLLFNAGLWAVIRPWRRLCGRIRQTVLVDTGVSSDQFTCSFAAFEKPLALDCWSKKRSSQTVVLRGLPDLGLTWTLPVSSNLFFYPLHLTFGYIEDVCHISSRHGLQALDDQHLSEVRLHFTWRYGVLGVFLYTPGNVLITVFVTGAALCDWLNCLKHDKTFDQAKSDLSVLIKW